MLLLLLAVIIKSLLGVIGNKPFTKLDNKLSLFLLIGTHIQFVVGLVLYVVSYLGGHRVQFNSSTMSTPAIRYFSVEHALVMVIVVTLITIGRSTSKKLADDKAKHMRLLILNGIALILILGTVYGMGAAYNSL